MTVSSEGAIQTSEIRACNEIRAELLRCLIRARNSIEARLDRLACPQDAQDQLLDWLEDLELALPDPAGLAEQMLRLQATPDQVLELADTLAAVKRELEDLPNPATAFLQAVSKHRNAERLSILYWAHLHYPLQDGFSHLATSAAKLLGSREVTQRRDSALIQMHADTGIEAVEVYSYGTMDLHGDYFDWSVCLYREGGRVFAQTHQSTSDEEGHAPAINEIQCGMDLADILRAGEGDDHWQISATEYLDAVERVFEFDADLGVDFLDALYHQYGVEMPVEASETPQLKAAWADHLNSLEATTDEPQESSDSADNPVQEGNCSQDRQPEDPIASILASAYTEPPQVSAGLRMWAGLASRRREQERTLAAREYALNYAKSHLKLPQGRHYITRAGRPGEEFWVEFPEQ